MWRRLGQHFLSIGLGQAINLAQQLLLPAAFLREYGVEGYAAWLVVLAAAGQLGNLDLGLQTYVVNRLTMLHAAGNLGEFRRVQSLGLRLTLALAALGFALLLGAQLLPLERWLKLDWAANEARAAILLLGVWVLLRMIQGQLAGVLRATGQPQRAQHWDNFQRVALLVSALLLIHFRCGFLWLAFAHTASALVAIALLLWDTRRSPVFPTVREWNFADARQMLRPSLCFGLTTLNFLVLYEAPLLILQWTAGPLAVVTFATTRTLFSAARQLLTPVQLAVQPELTRAFVAPDRGPLRELYRFSEAVALAGGSALTLGLAVLSPWVIEHWLHGKVAPSPSLLALLAAVTLATIFKDHKYALPLATNHHERATLLIGVGYLAMSVAGLTLAHFWQATGLLAAWLVTELALGLALQRQNHLQLNWPSPPLPLAFLGLTFAIGIGSFLALNALADAGALTRVVCASTAAVFAGLLAVASFGAGFARPARRLFATLNLCRQEA